MNQSHLWNSQNLCTSKNQLYDTSLDWELVLQGMVLYKMKYWWQYYLVRCIEKHFGEINIGDLDEML